MSWDLLKRFIESDVFNQNPFLSVAYLSYVLLPVSSAQSARVKLLILFRPRRYADHVGIHYVLCSKLRQFSYEEIEFFLPQLCHLIISVDNESMALEEFILDLCEESVNGALLVCSLQGMYNIIHLLIIPTDFLALSNISPRSVEQPAVRGIPSM
jgi:hypothetical protein